MTVTTTRPITIVLLPENQQGFLDILQQVCEKAGSATRGIGAYRTYRDASYLTGAEDDLDDLKTIVTLLQCGIVAAQEDN